jgi:hypothetical protein
VSPPDEDWVADASARRTVVRPVRKEGYPLPQIFFATAVSAGSMVAPIHVCSYGTAEQVAEVLP